MIYRDKYFIIVSIILFAYHEYRANDNIIDTTSTKSLSAMQCSGYNLECIVPLAASALPL